MARYFQLIVYTSAWAHKVGKKEVLAYSAALPLSLFLDVAIWW
jgi:hypothetical protein